jgi:hypothetical protein
MTKTAEVINFPGTYKRSDAAAVQWVRQAPAPTKKGCDHDTDEKHNGVCETCAEIAEMTKFVCAAFTIHSKASADLDPGMVKTVVGAMIDCGFRFKV